MLTSQVQLNVKVPMRDGTRLSTDVYLPKGKGPFPALLCRTIYDKQRDIGFGWIPAFVSAGYAVVMQDCRGRHDSDGEWEPYLWEATDGFDAQEWMGGQSWCDGSIGTFGISYIGFTQIQTAPLRNRFLKALAPFGSQEDNFGHFYVDGVLQLHVALYFINMAGRTMQTGTTGLLDWEDLFLRLPVSTAVSEIVEIPFQRKVFEHHTYDEFWKPSSLRGKYEEVEVPAFFVTGWYDNLLRESLRLFNGWTKEGRTSLAREATKLVIGPWDHWNMETGEEIGSIGFGADSQLDLAAEQIRWYDRRLKGADNGLDEEAPIRLFVMGENVWRGENEWPLARTRYVNYYLHSGGSANSLDGDGHLSRKRPDGEPPDHYEYDPGRPVPTLGGQVMTVDTAPAGPWDRSELERRDDVLIYTSDPLETDVEVTGPVSLNLYAASNAPDTDYTGTLVDVHPDGKAIILCEGILRLRYRESLKHPTLATPNEVLELCMDMWATSNLFLSGHRIRLEISSSNFPRFARNLNTGHHPNSDAEVRVASQTIHHDSARRSHLKLPVVDRG